MENNAYSSSFDYLTDMIDPSPDDDVLYPTDIYDENFFIKYTDDCLENRFDPLNNKQYEPENEYNSGKYINEYSNDFKTKNGTMTVEMHKFEISFFFIPNSIDIHIKMEKKLIIYK